MWWSDSSSLSSISNKLSGNRANPILNNQGRDDKNHTRLYRALKIRAHSSISLTRGGLILIGLLSGGDYAQAGLPGCGITTAHALACCGFGDSLYEAAITLPREALPGFLTVWRQGLREELKTNSRGIIGRKLVKLAKEVPTSFPDIDILLSYTSPVTSESLGRAAKKNLRPEWGREPDIGKLAALCEFYFEWGYKESIIKRFRTLLWHSVVLRILRQAVINAGASDHGSVMPSTSCKGKDSTESRIINTPSKMVAKHFSSMDLNSLASQSYGEVDSASEPLIIKIHSSRNHASTDGLLEYRLEVAPAQLVRLAESGIKGMREPPEKDEWASAEDAGGGDDNSAVRGNTKGPKPPPDPTSHMRLWMPACMLELAEPGVVEEYKRRKLNGEVKKNGKAPKYTSMPLKPLYDSEQDQCQTIDMLSERQRTMHSTPIRTAKDQEMKIQPIREESDESESDALIMPIFTRKAVSLGTRSTRSSKAAGPSKREKCSNSALDYLSLSDEENEIKHVNSWHATSTLKIESMPAPFLIPLDNDNDVFSPSDTQGQLTISAKTSYHRQMSDSERPKLPRKSLKHNSPRHLIEPHTHTISQSRQKPAPGVKKVVDLSIIEISSDDSDVTSSPVTCLRAKTHYSAINDGQGEVKR